MKRVMIVAICALLALATIGVTSASWEIPDMRTEGVVTTGAIDGRIEDPRILQGKKISVWVSPYGRLLLITMWNKNETYRVGFSVSNVGDIPLKVARVDLVTPPHVTAESSGEGTVVAVGDSESGFEVTIDMEKHVQIPAVVIVTLDCCVWNY